MAGGGGKEAVGALWSYGFFLMVEGEVAPAGLLDEGRCFSATVTYHCDVKERSVSGRRFCSCWKESEMVVLAFKVIDLMSN